MLISSQHDEDSVPLLWVEVGQGTITLTVVSIGRCDKA